MKYPNVLLIRHQHYSDIDMVVNNSSSDDTLQCTIEITSELMRAREIMSDKYHLLLTYGPVASEYSDISRMIGDRHRGRWIHKDELPSVSDLNEHLNFCFIHNVLQPRESTRPIFSVFTTCYNSYDKIVRAYTSLLAQSLIDWEWVILDDSPNDEHFQYLRNTLTDPRIRLYNRAGNSGSIGYVKNEAVMMCRGKYCIELDHDDEIVPSCLSDAAQVFDSRPEIGFIYMDFINMYEDATPFRYGDFLCKGYGGYLALKYGERWQYMYLTPNINNITMSHLVCCPNHPRIWRRDSLMKAGNFSELLPVCDDYEILLRTFMTTGVAKICKLGYIQYMNEGNSNFSLIRNGEINRIGPQHIMPNFYREFDVHKKLEDRDATEHSSYISNQTLLWTRGENFEHKFMNLRLSVDHTRQVLVIGLEAFKRPDVACHLDDPHTEVILLDNCGSIETLTRYLDESGHTSVKCWSLPNEPHNNREAILKYFEYLCKSCDDVVVIE